MCLDYTTRMEKLHRNHACSRPVAQCLEYIYDHLHNRITVPTLAAHAGIAPGYLSHLFAKEMGISVSSYIQNKKIETAQNMLCHSDYAISVISTTLAFPSQSYFTSVFRKRLGKHQCSIVQNTSALPASNKKPEMFLSLPGHGR